MSEETARKLVLVVIDGLTPTMLEGSLGEPSTPTLTALAAHGSLGRATTTFPSLTPVCLSSIATGAHPDVHQIPHLVWWHRGERRLVEYGSSFGAARAAGIGKTLRDTLVGLNAEHLGTRAVTVFEALADAGLRTASVNFTVYRGRTLHRPNVPFLGPVLGPERFYFYNLFRGERTGAPLSFRNRPGGTIDAYAAAVGRWLVTRDGFDFLLFYLSDYDYASHAEGPDTATGVLARCDEAVGGLVQAAGGLDEFLERYAVIVMSDHGQSAVRHVARLGEPFRQAEQTLVAASNRAGHVYRLGHAAPTARELALRLDGDPPSSSSSSKRRARSSPAATAWSSESSTAMTVTSSTATTPCSIIPTASRGRSRPCAARTPARWSSLPRTAGSLRISVGAPRRWWLSRLACTDRLARPRADGRVAGEAPKSVVDVAPLVLAHFGIAAPPYVLRRAA